MEYKKSYCRALHSRCLLDNRAAWACWKNLKNAWVIRRESDHRSSADVIKWWRRGLNPDFLWLSTELRVCTLWELHSGCSQRGNCLNQVNARFEAENIARINHEPYYAHNGWQITALHTIQPLDNHAMMPWHESVHFMMTSNLGALLGRFMATWHGRDAEMYHSRHEKNGGVESTENNSYKMNKGTKKVITKKLERQLETRTGGWQALDLWPQNDLGGGLPMHPYGCPCLGF